MKTRYSHVIVMCIAFLTMPFFITSCGEDEEEEVVITVPEVESGEVSEVTFSSAKVGGSIIKDGGAPVTAKGICWATTTAPTIEDDATDEGDGDEDFVSSLTDLLPNTKYFARAYATNSKGTSYGEEVSFTTGTGLPTLVVEASQIAYKKFFIDLMIIEIGGTEITGRGIVYSTVNNTPTISDNLFPFMEVEHSIGKFVEGLEPGTKYFVRGYAQNAQGTAFSPTIEVTTTAIPQLTDGDGNTYPSVLIGEKVWTAKNIKTTKFSNGDAIATTASVSTNITGETSPVLQWAPDGNEANVAEFGRLYTWFVVSDNRNVCGTGWHVATMADFNDLVAKAGSPNTGTKLKSTGTTHWNDANGTNTIGYSAVGAGMRWSVGTYNFFKVYGETWSSTESSTTEGKTFLVYNSSSGWDPYFRDKKEGLPIRCVKD